MLHCSVCMCRSLPLLITVHGCKLYVFFGTKWCRIFTGPLWNHILVEQTTTAVLHSRAKNPIEVRQYIMCEPVR